MMFAVLMLLASGTANVLFLLYFDVYCFLPHDHLSLGEFCSSCLCDQARERESNEHNESASREEGTAHHSRLTKEEADFPKRNSRKVI